MRLKYYEVYQFFCFRAWTAISACERTHLCSCLLPGALCGMLSQGVGHLGELEPEGGDSKPMVNKTCSGALGLIPCSQGIPQPVGCLTLNHVLRKLSGLGCDLSFIQLLHSHFSMQDRSPLRICVYLKGIKPSLHLLWDHSCLHILSPSFWYKEKLEENGLKIPAFLKLSVLSLHRQIIRMHVMARSKCTGINYSSRCFGDFSPLEFLHNAIKQLAVCPRGLGFIKWNTLQQGWFWLKMTPLRWEVLSSDL